MENIEEKFFVEEISSIRSHNGEEIVAAIRGHLGENDPGTSTLLFPDESDPRGPFFWMTGDGREKTHVAHIIGCVRLAENQFVLVELDYEGGHTAKRLKMISSHDIFFLSHLVGIVPKWLSKDDTGK